MFLKQKCISKTLGTILTVVFSNEIRSNVSPDKCGKTQPGQSFVLPGPKMNEWCNLRAFAFAILLPRIFLTYILGGLAYSDHLTLRESIPVEAAFIRPALHFLTRCPILASSQHKLPTAGSYLWFFYSVSSQLNIRTRRTGTLSVWFMAVSPQLK